MLQGVKSPNTDTITLSPNQIVAWNLERMRDARGWSQEEVARRLAPYLGYRLTRAAWSKAERSRYGKEIRRFDADEIVVLARLFEARISDFFMVPESRFNKKPVVINSKPNTAGANVTSAPLRAVELTAMSGNAILPLGSPNIVGMFRFLWNLALDYVTKAVISYLRDEPQAVAALVNRTPEALDTIRARILTKYQNLTPGAEFNLLNDFLKAAESAPEEGNQLSPKTGGA
jgi:hypothetical protein